MKRKISVVITDLDNTLFDWVDIWYKSFSAMLDCLVKKSGVSREILEREFKAVHQKHGTSEYAFSLEELPSLIGKHPQGDIVKIYDECVQAFRQARRDAMKLYPQVLETLCVLRSRGCLLVGYTESMGFYTRYRMKHLGLDGVLDYVYSPADHDIPQNIDIEKVRHYGAEHYRFRRSIQRYTPKGEFKPNADVLCTILKEVGARPEETLYVGDSLMKDIIMAQEVGVIDVYAKYGVSTNKNEYELLRRVTHWPDTDVEQEKQITHREVRPSHVLTQSLREVLDLFDFAGHVDSVETAAMRWEAGGDSRSDLMGQLVKVWEKTVDVQQHFNDLCLRIRNYALTVLTAFLGMAALALKEGYAVPVWGEAIPLASILLLLGVVVWIAFGFMDRYWYHVLLIGAVNHGTALEKALERFVPGMGLTQEISRTSVITAPLLRWKIHSKHKFMCFYLLMIIVLLVAAFSIWAVHKTPSADTPRPSHPSIVSGPNDRPMAGTQRPSHPSIVPGPNDRPRVP